MDMILQPMNLKSEVSHDGGLTPDGCLVRPVGGVSASRKQSVPLSYDSLMDLESTRLMEERYGIREEGLF